MSLLIDSASTRIVLAKGYALPDDPDAVAYITAVEAADTAAGSSGGLEPATRMAINSFVKGCKADGIWPAIKASCILAGAQTLAGALVPLVGTAPNKFGTEGGWSYNRKTGLAGNGTNNYLDTNRSATVDPLLNCHASSYLSSGTVGLASVEADSNGSVVLVHNTLAGGRMRNDTFTSSSTLNGLAPSFLGFRRTLTTGFTAQSKGASEALTATANNNPLVGNYGTHRYAGANYYTSRLAFYSIGESLDLALLDTRVTALIAAFAAIP